MRSLIGTFLFFSVLGGLTPPQGCIHVFPRGYVYKHTSIHARRKTGGARHSPPGDSKHIPPKVLNSCRFMRYCPHFMPYLFMVRILYQLRTDCQTFNTRRRPHGPATARPDRARTRPNIRRLTFDLSETLNVYCSMFIHQTILML